VDYVLRHIYKSNRPTYFQFYQSWRYWIDVYVAADKYLEPGASAKAYDNITSIAWDLQNIDEIFELLETLDTRMTDYPALVDFAAELQASHLNDLLKYDRFQKHVEEEPDAMWKIVNSLNTAKPITIENTAEPVTTKVPPNPPTLMNRNRPPIPVRRELFIQAGLSAGMVPHGTTMCVRESEGEAAPEDITGGLIGEKRKIYATTQVSAIDGLS
jgi:hypothetical protein